MLGFTSKKGFNRASLFPLVAKLGEYLKMGFDHYVAMKATGSEVDRETLQQFLYLQMHSWNPSFQGKDLLDEETKQAAIVFVTGIAFNMAKEK